MNLRAIIPSAAAAIIIFSASANAQETHADFVFDIDQRLMASEEGRQDLVANLERAAARFCSDSGSRGLRARILEQECFQETIERAMPQLEGHFHANLAEARIRRQAY